jgi:hypothetical protein
MWDLIENIINNHMEYSWEHQIPKKTPSTSSLQPFPPNSGLILELEPFENWNHNWVIGSTYLWNWNQDFWK